MLPASSLVFYRPFWKARLLREAVPDLPLGCTCSRPLPPSSRFDWLPPHLSTQSMPTPQPASHEGSGLFHPLLCAQCGVTPVPRSLAGGKTTHGAHSRPHWGRWGPGPSWQPLRDSWPSRCGERALICRWNNSALHPETALPGPVSFLASAHEKLRLWKTSREPSARKASGPSGYFSCSRGSPAGCLATGRPAGSRVR